MRNKKKVNSIVWKCLTVICHISLNPESLTDCRGMHVYHVNLMHLCKTSKYTLIMNFQVTQVLSLRLQSQTWRKVCCKVWLSDQIFRFQTMLLLIDSIESIDSIQFYRSALHSPKKKTLDTLSHNYELVSRNYKKKGTIKRKDLVIM